MSRSAATIMALVALLPVSMVAGCGGGDDAPRAAAEGGGASGSLADLPQIPRAGAGAQRVTFLLPYELSAAPLIWKEAAQREASKQNVVFSVRSAVEGESMAEFVRRVSQEGKAALVVVVDDAEALGPAIHEARIRGVPVVTILDEVQADGQPVPTIVREDYGPVADELVLAASNDAARLGQSGEGPALVLYSDDFPGAEGRAEALVQALERAGVGVIGDGPQPTQRGEEEVSGHIRRARAEHPGLAMVLAADDATLMGAAMERAEQPRGTGFAVAGFIMDPDTANMVRLSFASAAAFDDERVLGIFALRNALGLARGETIPDRIVTPMPVRLAPNPPAFGNLRTRTEISAPTQMIADPDDPRQ